MNAAADFEAAVRMLSRPLPAYVTYTQHAHAKIDSIVKDQTSTVTVRTSDGKIVKGKGLEIIVGSQHSTSGSILTNSPFDIQCYAGVSAKIAPYEGRDAEQIVLHDRCARDKDSGDFTTLYVDPATHEPLGVVGGKSENPVDVHLEQRWTHAGNNYVPSTLAVMVKGSGLMFWLDVVASADFSHYSFSDKAP